MEPWQQACAALKEAAELQGKTPEQIAEATGLKASNITRIFEGKYPPPLDVFFQIAQELHRDARIIDVLA